MCADKGRERMESAKQVWPSFGKGNKPKGGTQSSSTSQVSCTVAGCVLCGHEMNICPYCTQNTAGQHEACCPQRQTAQPYFWYTPVEIMFAQPNKIPYRCPVCIGTGLVSRPPHVAGDVSTWTDTNAGPYPCKSCNGTGIIWS